MALYEGIWSPIIAQGNALIDEWEQQFAEYMDWRCRTRWGSFIYHNWRACKEDCNICNEEYLFYIANPKIRPWLPR